MRITLLLSFFVFYFHVKASNVTIENIEDNKTNLSSHVELFLDSTKSQSFDQVIVSDYFKLNTQKVINLGFTEAPLWIRFDLEEDDLESYQELILEIGNSSLDVVEVFELDDNQLVNHRLLGDQIPFYERMIPFRNNLYAFTVKNHIKKSIYIKVQTNGALQVPIHLTSPINFFINHLTTETTYGIYIGIMLVMVIYNLLIFTSLKDLNYLYYAFPIISNATFFLSLSGHHFQYLFPNSPAIANNVTVISIAAWILSSSFYAKSSLQSSKYSKVADIALWVTMGLGLIGILLPFVSSYAFAVRFNSKMTLVNSLVMFVAGLLIWYKGNKSARFFILAWTAYLVGTFIFALMKFNFIEQNAFTKNVLAYGGIIEVLFLSLALSDKYKLYKREKERAQKDLLEQQVQTNTILEKMVKERTSELEEKKEELAKKAENLSEAIDEINTKNVELEQQNEEIVAQRDMVEIQRVSLQESNVKIQASINYAERIQRAMLPSQSDLKALFSDSFIIFKPKDIVSGDFYWSAKVGNKSIVAAVDCTGHGVPGALMSLVGNNLLQDIVVKTKIVSPEVILQALHIQITKSLYSTNQQLRDGMDLSLIVYDEKTKELQFGGARNPLCLYDGKTFEVIKGDRYSIGSTKPNVSFTTHKIKIERTTTIYLYSDGYQDQFGGDYDKKYGSKQFRELLKNNADMELPIQEQIYLNKLQEWMNADNNHYRQTDDILVIGIKLEV